MNLFKQNKEIILNSIKEQHYSNVSSLEEAPYVKVIEDILNNKIKVEDNIIARWDIELIEQSNKTYKGLIKAWNKEKLSITDINALQVDEDTIVGE